MDEEFVDLEYVQIKHETDGAWLIELGGNNEGRTEWFPKSRCEIYTDTKEVNVPDWLADDKELEYL